MTTQRELNDAMKEESDAMSAFSQARNLVTDAELKKNAARARLMLARAAKDALFQDLMSL